MYVSVALLAQDKQVMPKTLREVVKRVIILLRRRVWWAAFFKQQKQAHEKLLWSIRKEEIQRIAPLFDHLAPVAHLVVSASVA